MDRPADSPESYFEWALARMARADAADASAPVFLRARSEVTHLSAAELDLVNEYPAEGTDPQALRAAVAELLDRHLANGRSPRFQNQLFSGVMDESMAGCLMGIHPNNTLSTREIAPMPSSVERAVTRWLVRQMPWPDGEGDASLTPGGSFSNYLAVFLARKRATAEHGNEAICRLALFTSASAHYSIPKGGDLAGIPLDNVYDVAADEYDRMRPDALAAAIEEARSAGLIPFFVNATLGTTVTGVLDSVPDIADVTEGQGIWLHVDGAYGAAGLLSSERARFAMGLDRIDSLTWDPHKSAGAPVATSFLLVRRAETLAVLHPKKRGNYLFHEPEAPPDEADLGLTSLYCGKPFLALGPWLLWKSRGAAGLRAHIDQARTLTLRFRDHIVQAEHYDLALEPETWSVCFLPKQAPGMTLHEREALSHATRVRINAEGRWMLNLCPRRDGSVFRALFVNPHLTEDHVDELARHVNACVDACLADAE